MGDLQGKASPLYDNPLGWVFATLVLGAESPGGEPVYLAYSGNEIRVFGQRGLVGRVTVKEGDDD